MAELERRKIRGCLAPGRENGKGGEAPTKAGGAATAGMRKRLRDKRGGQR